MDDTFMNAAVESAKEGIQKRHGGPFGACVVKDGKVVAAAHNTVLRDKDPTCHAEVNAIRAACRELGTHVLEGCTLYTTAEPCPMCLSAIYWARIDEVAIGVSRETAAEFGFDDAYFYEQVELPPAERAIDSEYGVGEDACREVFVSWRETAGEIY